MSIKQRAKRGCEIPSVLALAAHEIEVAAFISLQDGLVEQMRIAALGPFRRRRGWQRRAALFQFGGVDQEIDASLGDIEPDHVAVLAQSRRAAPGGFRR